jgi:hypothetical protein
LPELTRIALLAACTAATTIAVAQGPTMFEGQALPQAAPGVQRSQQSPPQLSTSQTEPISTRNATQGYAWISFMRNDRFRIGGCLGPNEEKTWAVPVEGRWKVRAEVSRNPDFCVAPAACDVSVERRPGMGALELRGGGPNGCQWQPAMLKSQPQGAPGLKAVKNLSGQPVWVMQLAQRRGRPMELLATACIAPNGTTSFAMAPGQVVVGQAVRNSDDGTCWLPALCEAKLVLNSPQDLAFEGNAGACRWRP